MFEFEKTLTENHHVVKHCFYWLLMFLKKGPMINVYVRKLFLFSYNSLRRTLATSYSCRVLPDWRHLLRSLGKFVRSKFLKNGPMLNVYVRKMLITNKQVKKNEIK